MTRRRKPEETNPYGIAPLGPRPPVGPRPRPLPKAPEVQDKPLEQLPEAVPEPEEDAPGSSVAGEIFDRARVKLFYRRPIRP